MKGVLSIGGIRVAKSEFEHEKIVNETMETLKNLFNLIEDYLFIVDEKGAIIEANQAALERLGYSTEELPGTSILLLYPPERREEAFADTIGMLEGKKYKSTIPLYTKEKKYVPVETYVMRGKWMGKDVGFGICKDISSLKNQRRFLKSMIDVIPDLVFFKDRNSTYLGCNKAFAKQFIGLKEEEIVGKNDLDLLQNKEIALFYRQKDKEMFDTEKTRTNEEIIPMKDGRIVEVETVKTPFFNENGEIGGLIGIARDITERKNFEKQLRIQKEYAEMLLNTVPSAVFSVDKSRKIMSWNKWAQRLTGYSEEEALGRDCSFFTDFPCREKCSLYLEDTLKPETRKICTIRNKAGKTRDISKNMTPLKDETGEVVGGIECFDDITERIQMEEKLRESEERYSAIVNNAPETVIIHKMGKILFINDAGLKASGYKKSEVIGHNVQEFISRESRDKVLISLKSRIRRKPIDDYEVDFILKSGKKLNLIVKTASITYENEPASLAVLIDITERKRVEEELHKKDKILSAVAMSIKEFLENTDYLEAVKKSFELLGPAAQADRVYLFQNQYDEVGRGCTSLKIEWNSDESQTQINDLELKDLSFSEIFSFIEPLMKGEAYFGIVRELRNDRTKEILENHNILSIGAIPIFIHKTFWGFVGFGDCRLERKWSEAEFSTLIAFANSLEKAIERSMMNEELEQSRKEAEAANVLKGQFLANMSHEIRTPMNAVIGFVDLLFRSDLTEEQFEFLEQIKSASNGLMGLINDILDYSKIEANKMELEQIPFDMHVLVKETVSLFIPEVYKKNIEMNLSISNDVPRKLYGDPERIKQVLNNLIGNALKFTDRGEILVALSLLDDKEDYAKVLITVKDSGIGMSQEVLSKLFTVFTQADASTTRKYGGTGLGLAISQQIVKLMGGVIRVESVKEQGSIFCVEIEFEKQHGRIDELNVEQEERENIFANYNFSEKRRGSCQLTQNRQDTILLVEDMAANQKLAMIVLQKLGYNVELAENGQQAVFMSSKKKYDIILMDCQMPIMDGYEAASIIKNEGINKNTVVIAMTAHAMEGNREQCIAAGMNDYIDKPITMNKLDKIIKKWLNNSLSL